MKRIGLALCAALLCAANALAQEPAKASSRDVAGVVELFTSQGCASCPPADRVFEVLARDPAIVALAYHVDYWDYIGWKDTHGSRDNTGRQKAYAASLGSGSIYTPQVVVNGRRDVAGTKEKQIREAVRQTSLHAPDSTRPTVTLETSGDRLHIRVEGGGGGLGRSPVLMLITFDKRTETTVDRGENEGKVLASTNAVRDWRLLGMWEGKPMAVELPLSTLRDNGDRVGCAAVLQEVTADGMPGPIIAATALAP